MQPPVSASVVVASHGRPLRLRWLLNALEEQTFAEPWELIVVHDYDAGLAARIFERHPLSQRGVLRAIAIASGTGSPALQRNLGWRAARGEWIAFTDDDCRPETGWLDRLVATARGRDGGVVVQGRTRPDAYEHDVTRGPHSRSIDVVPVGPFAQTCNILYPRALLARLEGFDERAIAGEDVGLSLRARAGGATVVAAGDAIVNHAVLSYTLPGILRENLKWRHLAYLVRRHPELRPALTLRVFWDDEHAWTALALAGVLGATRRRALLALAAPYILRGLRRRGPEPRQRAIAALELPGQAIRQSAEVAGLLAGSVRHRTLVL